MQTMVVACNRSAASAHITAASALTCRIRAYVPQVREIITSCKDKVAGSLQPAVDQIVDICMGVDLAYGKHVLARQCGIHPENRGKTGVDPVNAQDLTKQIPCRGTPSPNSKGQWVSKRLTRDRLHQPRKNSWKGTIRCHMAFFGPILSMVRHTSGLHVATHLRPFIFLTEGRTSVGSMRNRAPMARLTR